MLINGKVFGSVEEAREYAENLRLRNRE